MANINEINELTYSDKHDGEMAVVCENCHHVYNQCTQMMEWRGNLIDGIVEKGRPSVTSCPQCDEE